ncbi:MAG: hypothetical protein KJN66_08230 [Bacteroidia bacterium]|nr:hypothetical protein [Bacteroidia bacterium]
MKHHMRILNYLLVISAMVLGCKDTERYQPIQTKNHSKTNQDTHEVVAKEFDNAGMYTYLKVSENDKEFWIAIPEKEIQIGETYYYKGGMKMVDFKSNELNKTFKEVWFVDALYNEDPPGNISPHSNNRLTQNTMKIIKQPENGISIENLLSDPVSFKNEEVIIKGKVVKINKNILDRNWVHIKDGTTFKDKSQITITTSDSVTLGDVLTFKGVVSIEKDFGYGYIYPILIENGILISK